MSVDEAHRQPEYDVLQLVRTKGGYLTILHFLAYQQGDELFLNSQTWDGVSHEDETSAEDRMMKLAAKHGVHPNNCCVEMLYCDPLLQHQYIVFPWGNKPFAESLSNGSTRFDGTRSQRSIRT